MTTSIEYPDEKGTDLQLENRESFEDADRTVLVLHDAALTRKLLWKLDLRILPMMAVLFLFSFLDRTNIGNAKILGLTKDLKLSGSQYANCLAIFFAFYIASEVPSNLVLKRVSPRIWLALLTFIWGVIAMCMGFVHSYTGLMVVRAFLGAAEGGLLPGIVLYLSMCYKRSEMALRLGLIYSSASLSGAFGGLLATGLNRLNGSGHLPGTSQTIHGWRWIFIVEGLMTAAVGVLAYIVLPGSLDKASFLTEEERLLVVDRLQRDKPSGSLGADAERFSWTQVNRAIFSIQTWLSASAYFCILTALYSFGLFVPTIINGLGYTAVRAQLFSVPPYAVAAALTVLAAFVSDRYKIRGPVMLCFLPLSIIGYAIIRTTKGNSVKYGALFLMASGLYPSVPPVLVWLSNNSGPHYKRATAVGLQLAIANCGGFPATFIYPAKQSPAYIEGHTIVMGLLCASWCLVALNCAYCHYQNKQKEAGKMEKYRGMGDDRDPDFKYII
ncbi:hypothetical protein QFC19_008619 [Naganishia cerealis]|uniref:Uncharacterized protein n=1 Tax=Naganishia cerealis TaxID=610337 RepID=A0ACC2V0Q1_9TREE|nr:hypothetical protein QFC19_008619 [Naganishia cerealis]